MKRVTILLATTIFLVNILAAQTPNDLTIPPSPTVANLMKFVDIPVNLYTGIPSIEIPLYELKGKSLSIPIGLKYHGGGIKAQDTPDWLGYSWALEAGGSISRTIMGKADELTGGYIEFSRNFPNSASSNSWTTFENNYLLSMAPDPNVSSSAVTYDAEPDIFTFSFPNHSGKFVFITDSIGNTSIQIIPHQNLKITPSKLSGSDYFTSFEVISEDGTKYVFGDNGVRSGYDIVERTVGAPLPVSSSWHLLDIISNDSSDTIKFTYSTGNGVDDSNQLDIYDEYQDVSPSQYGTLTTCSPSGIKHINSSFGYITRRLAEINSQNCRIEFTSSGSPVKLTSMSIYSGTDNIKSFDFTYTSSYIPFLLSSVKETSNGISKPSFILAYNSVSIPLNTTTAVDYWGYYNGKTGNLCKIPSDWIGATYYQLGNLEPSANHMIAGSLTKITYPTGGYSEFTFEPNDYGSTETWENIIQNEYERISKTKSVTASCGGGTSACCLADGDLNQDSFLIDQAQTVSITVSIASSGGNNYLTLDSNTYTQNITTNVLLQPGTHTLTAHADCLSNVSISVNYTEADTTPITKKMGGGLRIKKIVHYNGVSHQNDIIKEYGYTRHSDPTRSSGVLISGIPKYKDDYYYHNTACSGDNCFDYFCHYIRLSSNPIFILGSVNGSPIVYPNVVEYDGGKINGSINGYNGRTESTFSFYPPILDNNFPYAPPVSYDWKNGLLREKICYNSEGTKLLQEEYLYLINESLRGTSRTFVPGIKARFRYRGVLNPSIYLMSKKYYSISVGIALLSKKTETVFDINGASPIIKIEDYKYSDLLLSEQTLTTSNNKKRTNLKLYPHNYNYSSGFISDMYNKHILNKPIENIVYESDSNGNNIKIIEGTITEYLTGLQSGLPESNYKIEANSPIDVNNFRFSNCSISGLPSGSPTSYSRNDNYYKLKLSFKYNSLSNLIEYNQESNIKTSFIWAYKGILPVAKIENIAQSQISPSIITAIQNHTFTNSTVFSNIQTDINYLKTQLSSYINNSAYQVTLYTYKPLFGLTSQTDPNGKTTYYEYDTFGRLQFIKDDQGKILKKYDYHYATQNP
jgi:YD repeat-containing protein